MPAQVTNYKCPTCTGPLHFVGASGKLECDYCGASYDVAQIEALYAEKEGKAAAAQSPSPTAMIMTGTSVFRFMNRARSRRPRTVPSTPRKTEAQANPLRCSRSHTAMWAGRPVIRCWRPT